MATGVVGSGVGVAVADGVGSGLGAGGDAASAYTVISLAEATASLSLTPRICTRTYRAVTVRASVVAPFLTLPLRSTTVVNEVASRLVSMRYWYARLAASFQFASTPDRACSDPRSTIHHRGSVHGSETQRVAP